MTTLKKGTMISVQSRLDETETDIVLDASVLINILATGYAERILGSLERKVFITSEAYSEVSRDPYTNRDASETVKPLEIKQLLLRRDLGVRSKLRYELLVNPTRYNLGKGEAATIGYCEEHKLTAVIDERKGRTVATNYADVAGTIDLLAYKRVFESFDPVEYREALLNAGILGRMYIPFEWGQWAENILHESVARELLGLRRYYRLRDEQ